MPARFVDLDDRAWAAFVASRTEATPFHHPAWAAALASAYGYRPFVVALGGSDGQIEAGLPVLEARDPLRGRRWISLPFTDHCRPLAGSGDAHESLLPELERLAGAAGVRRVEVRGAAEGPAWSTHAAGVLHTLALSGDAETLRKTFSRSQVQRNIARGEGEELRVVRGTSRTDVQRFYALHLRTRRRQGVPVQPRRFFEAIRERMLEPGRGFVSLVYSGDAPVAGALFLTWNGTVTYKFGASDPDAWRLRPNHLLFWDAIRWGCDNGYHSFDFGRTDAGNEGLLAFKSGWGTEARTLDYSELGATGGEGGRARGRAILATAIQRSPLWVCRLIGASLYRYAA